jgi:hypothetical protein
MLILYECEKIVKNRKDDKFLTLMEGKILAIFLGKIWNDSRKRVSDKAQAFCY